MTIVQGKRGKPHLRRTAENGIPMWRRSGPVLRTVTLYSQQPCAYCPVPIGKGELAVRVKSLRAWRHPQCAKPLPGSESTAPGDVAAPVS